jgi:hypothetical protein
MATGYCIVDDVRRALRQADLPGDAQQDREIVLDAIEGTTEWLRKSLDAHFYVPGGVTGDTDNLVPSTVRTRGPEHLDIPSTPHTQHSSLFTEGRHRHPLKTSGPFVSIPLDKQDVQSISTLDVRDASGDFEDWVAASGKTSGDDYRLVTEASTPGRSKLELRAASLPALRHYDRAVSVTYDYGTAELPQTVRRAVAFKAAAELAEDAVLQIPQQTEIYDVESLADFFDRKASEKLAEYR